jgi:hypothetical protein
MNEYLTATDEEKLLILQSLYQKASKKNREVIVKESQKVYNRLKCRKSL